MGKRGTLTFVDSKRPISSPATKFGGQPTWLSDPQWPLSRSTGEPMRFIGQIAIPAELFPHAVGKLAYVFMTESDDYVDGTWEPAGGENAVIIQPVDGVEAPIVEVASSPTGPTLQRHVKRLFTKKLHPMAVEIEIGISWEDEPDFLSDNDRSSRSDAENEAYWDAIQGTKLGGAPAFVQYDEYPDADCNWGLLMQIDSCDVPFSVNFGDAGVAYIYIDTDAKRGRMLWQCS